MLRIVGITILAVSLLAAFAATVAATPAELASLGADAKQTSLKLKVYRDWSIHLPAEKWSTVGTGFEFEEGLGAEFDAHLEGTALAVDVDADGSTDIQIETPEGHVILKNGEHRYAARVKTIGDQWQFAPGGAMLGSIDGTKLRFIDQNNNGRFDDYGQDALVVGNGRAATLLSRTVPVGDKLHEVAVSADGQTVEYRPYAGETSTLRIQATTRGKILAGVVTSECGEHSFSFTGRDSELTVPVGKYTLHSATIALGGNSVKMRTGKSQPVEVRVGEPATLAFGGPIQSDFLIVKEGFSLVFSPNSIWYYGSAGEEYYDWQPLGASPLITLHDPSGREIASARFGGQSCGSGMVPVRLPEPSGEYVAGMKFENWAFGEFTAKPLY